MQTTIPFKPAHPMRQPIITFQPTPARQPSRPGPTHDFLVLSPCPDFTPEINTAGTTNHRERVTQLCA